MARLTHLNRLRLTARLLICASLMGVLADNALAQMSVTSGPSDARTPSGADSGAGATNPYNGNLTYAMPLLQMAGRGEVKYTVNLLVEQKWTILHTVSNYHCMNNPHCSGPQHTYTTRFNWAPGLKPGFGPGVLQGRQAGNFQYYTANPTNQFSGPGYRLLPPYDGFSRPQVVGTENTLTRLTFSTNDGAEFELVDKATEGRPVSTSCSAAPLGYNRGRIFVSRDGTSMTFVASSDVHDISCSLADPFGSLRPEKFVFAVSGYLYMKDGTVYGIDAGRVTSIRDRNGNTMEFAYDTSGNLSVITDSVGREVTFAYESTYTQINSRGFGGQPRTIRIHWDNLENILRSDQVLKNKRALFSIPYDDSPSESFNPRLVSSVDLPNNQRYRLHYTSYGELARLELPTGGAFEYDHAAGVERLGLSPEVETTSGAFWMGGEVNVYRRVVERRTYPQGGTGAAYEVKTLYSRERETYAPVPGGGYTLVSTENDGFVYEDQRDAAGALLSRIRHFYYGDPLESLFHGSYNPAGYTRWNEGREYRTEEFAAGGQTVLRRVDNEWAQRAPVSWWQDYCASPQSMNYCFGGVAAVEPPNDVRLTRSTVTLVDSGLTSRQEFAYDAFNNQTDVWEYDYAAPGATQPHPLRHTHTDYLSISGVGVDYTSAPIHIRHLPLAQRVYAVDPSTGAEALAAQTETRYDEVSLFSYGSVAGWVDPGSSARGNPTSMLTWLNTDDSWPQVRVEYDQCGSQIKTYDALGNVMQFEYSALHNYAYPTRTLTPVPDPTGKHGSNAAFETSAAYDPDTGLATSKTDVNGQTTTFEFDILSRPKKVTPPAGGAQLIYEYSDTPGNLTVTIKRQIDETAWDEGVTYFDGLGRSVKTRSRDARGDVFSETVYDSLGRIRKTSNPYRPGETKYWVETVYGDLGRIKEVISPRVAGEAAPAKLTSEYSAATAGGQIGLVQIGTNQAGKKGRSITNALGQLIRVDEQDIFNDLGPIDNPRQPTYYTCDTLGNLRKVSQGSQSRYFLYDSLGRLIRVRQPEQDTNPALSVNDPVSGNAHWSVASAFDENGNLRSTTDAKGVTISYDYDNLNRVVRRRYTVPQTADPKTFTFATADVTFKYDGRLSPTVQTPNPAVVPLAQGILSEVSNDVSTTQQTGFDNLGRVRASRQIMNGREYSFQYQYNLTGGLIEQTYPSGRVVTNVFDGSGDLSSVSSNLPQQAPQVFASNFKYAASGDVIEIKLGNGRWETYQLNSRNQVRRIGLGTSATDTSLWKVEYEYGRMDQNGDVDVTKNDGNVIRQTVTVPGAASPYAQTYSYDSLNRLTEAAEVFGGQQTWRQTFGYDRYGNRVAFSQVVGQTQLTPNNVNHPAIDPLNNRFLPGQGYEYDRNGNLIRDAEGRRYVFDGDNRQREVRDANDHTAATYSYDGNGRRVRKTVASTQEVTIFIYDAAGKLAAEYSNIQPQIPTRRFITADVLDTPRVITNAAGDVISRKDYMPFGEELAVGRGGEYGFGSGVRRGFTGYEKDDETQLNFAEARYYNHQHARFTTVDPLLTSGKSVDPQTFNRYVYAGNNPTLRVDPNGEAWYVSSRLKIVGGVSVTAHEYYWSSEPRGMAGYTKTRNNIVYLNAGVSRGWHVLDPWERRAALVSSAEAGLAQLERFRRQAVLNYITGVADALSLSLDMLGVSTALGAERGSEMYAWGQKHGTMLSVASAVTGVGLINAVINKFGKAGLTYLRGVVTGFRVGSETVQEVAVIGKAPGTLYRAGQNGVEIFTMGKYSFEKNMKWIDQMIERRVVFELSCPINESTLYNAAGELTIFGQEVRRLEAAGYYQWGNYMLPPR